MSTLMRRPEATVTIAEQEVAVDSGSVTLDSSVVPYAQAQLELALVGPEDIELIDPREDVRAVVEVSETVVGTARTFDLGVRSREVDHKAKVIRLELASDEAQLMDYAPLEPDSGAREYETSLRDVCNYVLDKIGAELEEGSDDADLTAAWEVRNHIRNPRAAINTSLWLSPTVNATLSRVATGGPNNGPRFVSTATAGAGGIGIFYGPGGSVTTEQETELRVQPGQTIRFAMDMTKGSTGGNSVQLRLRFSNGTRYLDVLGDHHTPALGVYERIELEAVVPPGMTSVAPWLGSSSGIGSWPVGTSISMSNISLTIDAGESVPFFDGATSADARYTYEWDGDANASSSRRVPIVERPRELFTWKPGVTAWEFLEPLTSLAGLRLFCDEQRVWRLVDPSEYSVPGVLNVAGFNATEGVDRISRDDRNTFCTGVVVKYRWRDDDGEEQEAFDTAGEPGVVLLWEYERPYPGPGAAAAILARRSGAGRVQDVTALTRYDVTPGNTVSISLPATIEQQGPVTSVSWTLQDALMRIGSNGLIDIQPGSIDTLDGMIDDLVGNIDGL